MNRKLFIMAVIAAVAMVFTTQSCKKDDTDKNPVKTVTLDQSTSTLNVGQTLQLKATVLPKEAKQEVKWTSDKADIAKVDAKGLVTALKEGKAVITATSTDNPKISAKCEITVSTKDVPVAEIKLDNPTIELTISETKELKATVLPENATNKEVEWASDKSTIVEVSDKGVVKAVAEGVAKITVTAKDGSKVKAECTVTVRTTRVAVQSITLNQSELILDIDATEQLNATVLPEDATNKEVTWESSDETIAKVSAEGLVTAIKDGTAKITVTPKDGSEVKAECAITVNKKIENIATINLTAVKSEIDIDETTVVTAAITPATATDKEIEFFVTSSDKDAVTLTGYDKEAGTIIVTGKKAGEVKIQAKAKDAGEVLSNELTITVKAAPIVLTGIEVAPATLTLESGDVSGVLVVTPIPAEATLPAIKWSSDTQSVATVVDGVVTAATVVSTESAIITATTDDANAFTAICLVTVNPKVVVPTKITLDPATLTLAAGATSAKINVVAEPLDATMPAVTWSSSDENVATVVDGIVTAANVKENKTADIIATIELADGSKLTATCSLTVEFTPVLVASITIQGATKVTEGETITLTASVSPNDATNAVVKWASDDTDIATVDEDTGVVTGVAAGTANIKATATDGSAVESGPYAIEVEAAPAPGPINRK